MSRPRSGFIGYTPQPAASAYNSAAGGIWTLREAEELTRAGTWQQVFSSPTQISGLQLWLDASDAGSLYDSTAGGSLVAADGGVARWEDKSGNARHMTQGTAGSRPTRKTAIQGGLDVLRFDGSNDAMSIAASMATFKFLHGSAYSIFAVVRVRALNTREFIFETGPFGSPSGDDGSLGAALAIFSDGKLFHFARAGETAEINNQSAASTLASGSNYLVSVVGDVSSGTAAARSVAKINAGSAIQNNAQTDAVSTSNARIDLTIGRGVGYNGDGSVEYSDYADLDFCEIAIYNSALSDTARSTVESYLMRKWGIA
jgi:hypothetical protein